MFEVLHYDGYTGEAVEVISSRPRTNVKGGKIRDVFIKGGRTDLGMVLPDGWSGGPETTFPVINVSPNKNMPPFWKRVFWEQDVGNMRQVFVEGHVPSGKHIQGIRGAETVFMLPLVAEAA